MRVCEGAMCGAGLTMLCRSISLTGSRLAILSPQAARESFIAASFAVAESSSAWVPMILAARLARSSLRCLSIPWSRSCRDESVTASYPCRSLSKKLSRRVE